MDKPEAVPAIAHKLTRLIYTLRTKAVEYTDKRQDYFVEGFRQWLLHNLAQRAAKMCMRVVQAEVIT